MRNIILLVLITMSFAINAQVQGRVTDENGNPLPAVTIHIQDTYKGTTTNDSGAYYLDIKDKGKYVIVYQYLGYKSQKVNYEHENTLKTIDIQLAEENIELNTVVIDRKNNNSIYFLIVHWRD